MTNTISAEQKVTHEEDNHKVYATAIFFSIVTSAFCAFSVFGAPINPLIHAAVSFLIGGAFLLIDRFLTKKEEED